jgi:cyanate lyase
MTKKEAAEAVALARHAAGVTWAELAELVGRPEVWSTAALLGQHPLPRDAADRIAERLGLDDDVALALTRQPYRGAPEELLRDPTIYRLHEIVLVYGPTIKELIHEKFGDGIMSAINFSLDVGREEHDGEARVVIKLDGKYLPYQW